MNSPQRKHPERQVGEHYRDALTRVAGERDAAYHDIARLRVQVTDMRTLADICERRGDVAHADQIRRVLDAHLLPVEDYDGEAEEETVGSGKEMLDVQEPFPWD